MDLGLGFIRPVGGRSVCRGAEGCACRFGGGWGEGMGAGAADAEMDEDVYAQRIWERMEQKKRAASGASAAARDQWGKADEASARRQVGRLPACVPSSAAQTQPCRLTSKLQRLAAHHTMPPAKSLSPRTRAG